jgi:hypothetical protein
MLRPEFMRSFTETGALLRTVRSAAGSVRSVALSPDGRFILAGGPDARLREAATGQLNRIFETSEEAYSVAFSPDGHRLLTGGVGAAALWDIRDLLAKPRFVASQGGREIHRDLGTIQLAPSLSGPWTDLTAASPFPPPPRLRHRGPLSSISRFVEHGHHEIGFVKSDSEVANSRLRERANTASFRLEGYTWSGTLQPRRKSKYLCVLSSSKAEGKIAIHLNQDRSNENVHVRRRVLDRLFLDLECNAGPDFAASSSDRRRA